MQRVGRTYIGQPCWCGCETYYESCHRCRDCALRRQRDTTEKRVRKPSAEKFIGRPCHCGCTEFYKNGRCRSCAVTSMHKTKEREQLSQEGARHSRKKFGYGRLVDEHVIMRKVTYENVSYISM